MSGREGWAISGSNLVGDLETESSLNGLLSGAGKYSKVEEKEVSLWDDKLLPGAQEVRKKLSFMMFWLLSTSAEKSSKRISLRSWLG